MKEKKQKHKQAWWEKLLTAFGITFVSFMVLMVALPVGIMIVSPIIAKFYPGEMDMLNDSPSAWVRSRGWHEKLPQTDDWQRIVEQPIIWPNLDGSTVMVPMAVEFARQHLGMDADAAAKHIKFRTTHHAYAALFAPFGEAQDSIPDLVLGTAPGEEELKIAHKNGVMPVQKPVCRDAFVFITGKNNPVESLALEQVRGIFSGKIKNWKEVGGADEKIQAYQREPGSGSQTGMEQLVMQGLPMADPKIVKISWGMGGLVDAVAEYENSAASIGYSYRYYIDNQYSSENIKQLKIEGVAPTDENIRSGAYPLSVNYVGVYRHGEENGHGAKFLEWILSEEGQACVEQAGYIKLSN